MQIEKRNGGQLIFNVRNIEKHKGIVTFRTYAHATHTRRYRRTHESHTYINTHTHLLGMTVTIRLNFARQRESAHAHFLIAVRCEQKLLTADACHCHIGY